ncbi:MAG: hypothetical protein OER86_10365 [Phycisphaerae bacterium]|nr:hypothetical protein [Phycisphaerae bacterium]
MATSFGALCTDFYVNQKLGVKMDLPDDRETILHLFDRIRSEFPAMKRFRRYSDELALESSRQEGSYSWMAMRRNSVRSGHVNPDTLDQASELHRLILQLVPYNLSISPLDVEYLEVLFGFDLETKANQNEIVYDALFAGTPLAGLLDDGFSQPIDIQPSFGISLNEGCDVQAFFEVKTATSKSQVKRREYRTEPISVFLTLRRVGGLDRVEDLLDVFAQLRQHAERLATERLVPQLLTPISRAITSSA